MTQFNWVLAKAKFWKHFPVSARPWPSEVKWFEQYALQMSQKGRKDVLILGATVEFRSMLHKLGLNVYMVDFSKQFVDIISKQPMKYRGPETFYEQNWLTMKLPKKFDLIFGDWIPGVLHTKFYDQFFRHVVAHLNPHGLFITRSSVRLRKGLVNLEQKVKDHYARYAKQHSLYTSISHFLYAYAADSKTSMGNLPKALEEVQRINAKGLIKPRDYRFILTAISKQGAPASVMVKKDFEKFVRKYFTIKAIHYGTNMTASWFPIYVLSPKHQ